MSYQEEWRLSPADQKETEDFFTRGAGERLLLVLRERNQPQESPLPGMDGIHEDSKTLQRWAGWERCLDAIPGLFFGQLGAQKMRTDAQSAQDAHQRARRSILSPKQP